MVVNTTSKINTEQEQYSAIAYYRLSKDDGNKRESDSISNQRKLVHAFLENNTSIHLVDEQYDDGYTGTNYDRPGFRAVMEAIQSGRANCIIVKDLSRLGREYIETGKYLEMIFPSFGVRFIAINDDVDSEHSNPGDDIIIPVKNIMNEAYCRELSKKLRKQFRIQRSNGEFIGSFAAYGYCKSPEDKHKLIIDEYAAEVVRGIFHLKLKGYSQQAIADYLNAEQILSPAEYKKSIGLKYKSGFMVNSTAKWSPITVKRILNNSLYIGTLTQGVRGTPNYKVKKLRERKEEEWVVVENNHEKIVDPLVFATVQQILKRDTRTSPNRETVFPLAGVIFCHNCQRPMYRKSVPRGKRVFYYYACSLNKQGKGCPGHSIAQNKLEAVVFHAIKNQIHMVIEMDKLIHEVGEDSISSAKVNRLDLLIGQKNKDLDTCTDFRTRLYEALNDNLIDKDEYNRMREKYTKKIEEAQQAINKLSEQRDKLLADTAQDFRWMEQFLQFKDEQQLTREMVVALIDRIYVFEDKHVRIDFNYRDEIGYLQQSLEQAAKEVS